MQKKKIILIICVLCFSTILQMSFLHKSMNEGSSDKQSELELAGDPTTFEWVRIYDDPASNWDEAYDATVDSYGNVYCVGSTINNMILWKYNSKGDYILNRTWHFGSDYADAKAVALDSSDNIYVAGQVALREEMFLLKYNYTCDLQWARVWGGSEEDPLTDMAIDSFDNIYIAGSTKSFSMGGYDMCLVKYDPSGNQLWNRTWGSWNTDMCSAITIDSFDNIYLGGHTASYGDGYTDMCLVKYNSTGGFQWYSVWERGGDHYEFTDDLVIDSAGDIFIAVHDNNVGLPILVKVDPSGNEIWNRTYSGYGYFWVEEMEIDDYDNLYVGATFDYRDFGFAKINKHGDFQWSATWGTADDEFCEGMALNSTGHIYLCGYRSFHSYGPMVLAKFKINPPDTPNFTDTPQDFSIYENDNTKNITWTPLDDSYLYDSYWILREGTKVEEGSWDGDQIIYSDLAVLTPGVYNFTCFVNNSYGKLNSSSVEVTILSNIHIPDIYNNTSDSTFNLGSINYVLSWHAFDLDGNTNAYQVKKNSSVVDSGLWNNDTDILFTETQLLNVGVYNYTCFVNDTSGATNQSTIFVTIINHDPSINKISNDVTLNYGAIGYTLSWYVSDPDGNSQDYLIERNNITVDTGTWANNSNINYLEISFLTPGIYNFTCFINDTVGAVNQSSIFVEINAYPYFSDIETPSNNIYSPNADYSFNCSFFDDDGIVEEIYFEFNGDNYTVTDDYLGEYIYTLNDLSANENGYAFRWHVKDDDDAWTTTNWQAFILNKRGVQLQILFNGTTDNYFYQNNPLINITVINLNSTPGLLKLLSDNGLLQEEYDFSLVNFSLFIDGTYNITAILIDENYTANAMKWLFVREIDPPDIIFEDNGYYLSIVKPEYSDDELRVICTVNDYSPLSWVYCYENSSGTFMNQTMDSLGNGNWTYTIDISGLNWNDVFFFSFYANDTRGNIGFNDNSTMLYKVFLDDFQKPVTALVFTPYNGVNEILESTIISLTSSDNSGSGISYIKYKIEDSIWYDYDTPINLSTYDLRYYEIFYYAGDVAGNIEDTKSFILHLVEETSEPPPPSPPQPAIPGFDIIFLLFSIGLGFAYLTKKRLKFLNKD